MHKKIILFLMYSVLFILIIAPTQAQLNIQTIQLPELQPITAENISQLQLLGALENFEAIAGRHATNFAISPNHQWLAVSVFGGILMYDLLNDSVRILGISTDLGIGGFSNDSTLYVMPTLTQTNIYDTTLWNIIGTLPDGFVAGNVRFSADDQFIATYHENRIRGYMGEKSTGIYIFETNTWSQANLLPLDLYVQSYVPFAFQTYAEGDLLITHNVNLIYEWDYRNVTNYGNPERASKSDLIALLESRVYPAPDAVRYRWVGFGASDGDYALWLTLSDGGAIFAKPDGTYENVVAGETGTGHDENGIPESYGDYTRLARPAITQLLLASERGEVTFGTPTGEVVIISRTEASQTAPAFIYDPSTDTLINHRDDEVYTAQETETTGEFINEQGDVRFAYRLDLFPAPPNVSFGLSFNMYGYQTDSLTTDGDYIIGVDKNRRMVVHHLPTGDEIRLEGLTPEEITEDLAFFVTANDDLVILTFFNRESSANEIKAWMMDDGMVLERFITDTFRGKSVMSDDGQLLVIGGGLVKDRIEFWGVPQS